MMKIKEAYLQVSARNLASAKALAQTNVPESSAFCSYHAFESLGGALTTHLGKSYPRSHEKKINQFVQSARQINHQLGHSVSTIAITLRSLGRNDLLYPIAVGDGSYTIPENKLSRNDADKLRSRIAGIDKTVRQNVT